MQRRRTVAVTGAGSGIGRAIAQAFAGLGDHVMLADISRERLDEAVQACGPDATSSVVDVADYEQVETWLNGAAETTGHLDVLVNAAGVFDAFASIDEISLELWRRVIDIDLGGCFHGARAASPIMIAQRSGRIISLASISSFRGGPNGVAYTTAKAGIIGLTRRVAFDLAPHGITANAICPGIIPTDIRANSAEILDDEAMATRTGAPREYREFMLRAGRMGTVEEVAAVALFLASPEAAYVNGESIAVDGGWLAT